MTTYVADSDGNTVCEECMFSLGCPCEAPECRCDCRYNEMSDRAEQLDDRPAETLARLARDMEAERRPDMEALQRERFGLNGWPTRGRA